MMSLFFDLFYDFIVIWVEDLLYFWCQFLINIKIIVVLMENLAEVYINLELVVLFFQLCIVGYFCCVKFYEDDVWYRGVIINVSFIVIG